MRGATGVAAGGYNDKVRSERAEDTNLQAKLADAAQVGQNRKNAANTAECRADKLQELQIEANTAKLQLEEEFAKAWACLSLMDEGRGGGCSLDIEAAMAQVVARLH